jgi:hypothetical protein
MNLTKKRLELLLTALGTEETHLIDDGMWVCQYRSERAAQKEIDATRAWVNNQLNKRGA